MAKIDPKKAKKSAGMLRSLGGWLKGSIVGPTNPKDLANSRFVRRAGGKPDEILAARGKIANAMDDYKKAADPKRVAFFRGRQWDTVRARYNSPAERFFPEPVPPEKQDDLTNFLIDRQNFQRYDAARGLPNPKLEEAAMLPLAHAASPELKRQIRLDLEAARGVTSETKAAWDTYNQVNRKVHADTPGLSEFEYLMSHRGTGTMFGPASPAADAWHYLKGVDYWSAAKTGGRVAGKVAATGVKFAADPLQFHRWLTYDTPVGKVLGYGIGAGVTAGTGAYGYHRYSAPNKEETAKYQKNQEKAKAVFDAEVDTALANPQALREYFTRMYSDYERGLAEAKTPEQAEYARIIFNDRRNAVPADHPVYLKTLQENSDMIGRQLGGDWNGAEDFERVGERAQLTGQYKVE